MDLKDKHVVITGGSKGVGAALARELVKHKAKLTLIARPSEELNKTAAETGAVALAADLSDMSVIKDLIRRVEEKNGPVDVLINNAGISDTRNYVTSSASSISAAVVTNLLAPMELSRQAVVGMLRRNCGAILNVSSLVGEFAIPGCTAYASAKAGLTTFSHSLQRDIRDSKVNVTVVVLGAVAGTHLYDEAMQNETLRKLAEQLNKIAKLTPEDVARRFVKALISDHRGAMALPWSSAMPMYLRMLTIKMGDLVFCHGKQPPDPELAELLKQNSAQGS